MQGIPLNNAILEIRVVPDDANDLDKENAPKENSRARKFQLDINDLENVSPFFKQKFGQILLQS